MGTNSSHDVIQATDDQMSPPASPHVRRLFENNRKWVQGKVSEVPNFFESMKDEQKPKYLWIGCSDSRVVAETITGCNPGDMFITRNIANLVVNSDINILSVLQLAVEQIKVNDIIVCGHYGCGGIEAALANKESGLLDHWLRNIRDVRRLHKEELNSITDTNARTRRLVELNVIEQCVNLLKNGIVQRRQLKHGVPRVHGMVYDIQTGYLKELQIDFKNYIENYKDVYSLYPLQRNYSLTTIARGRLQAKTLERLCSEHLDAEGRIEVETLKRMSSSLSDLLPAHEIDTALAHSETGDDGKVDLRKVTTYFSSFVDTKQAEGYS